MGHAWGAWQWHNWRLIMLRNEARIKVKEPKHKNLQFKVNRNQVKQQREVKVKTTGEDGAESWLTKTEVDIIFIFARLFSGFFVCLHVFF